MIRTVDNTTRYQIRVAVKSAFIASLGPGSRVVKVGGNGGPGTVLEAPKGVGGNRGCMVEMDEGGKRWFPVFTLHPERAGTHSTACDDARPWFV